MASSVALSVLRTKARRRADQENSSFISDAELTDYINTAIKDIYDLLVAAGEHYYLTSTTIATDGSTKAYNLPSDFYKLAGVDYTYLGESTSMEPYVFNDRNNYSLGTNVIRYLVIKNQIKFEPVPPAQTMTLWYIPAFTDLSDDADTFDGVNGWEEYAVLQAAIYCKNKAEEDPQALILERQKINQRIIDMVINRDQGLNEKVSDVSGWYDVQYEALFS